MTKHREPTYMQKTGKLDFALRPSLQIECRARACVRRAPRHVVAIQHGNELPILHKTYLCIPNAERLRGLGRPGCCRDLSLVNEKLISHKSRANVLTLPHSRHLVR